MIFMQSSVFPFLKAFEGRKLSPSFDSQIGMKLKSFWNLNQINLNWVNLIDPDTIHQAFKFFWIQPMPAIMQMGCHSYFFQGKTGDQNSPAWTGYFVT